MNVTLKTINTAGEDISILANEIKEIFDDTFDSVERLAGGLGWSGESANEYLASLKVDKSFYNNFKNELNNYSAYLRDYASEMHSSVSKMNAPGVDMTRSNNMGFNITLDNNSLNNIVYPSIDRTVPILNDAINSLSSSPYANDPTINNYRNQINNVVNNLNWIENSIKDASGKLINTDTKYESHASVLPSELIELRKNKIV